MVAAVKGKIEMADGDGTLFLMKSRQGEIFPMQRQTVVFTGKGVLNAGENKIR